MAKQLSVTMINMYKELAEKEYKPLIEAMERKSLALRPVVENEVKHSLGIYGLMAEMAAIEAREAEIKDQLNSLIGVRYYDVDSYVEKEVNRRLLEINKPLAETRAAFDATIKEITLMGANSNIQETFDKIAASIAQLTSQFGNAEINYAPQHQIAV